MFCFLLYRALFMAWNITSFSNNLFKNYTIFQLLISYSLSALPFFLLYKWMPLQIVYYVNLMLFWLFLMFWFVDALCSWLAESKHFSFCGLVRLFWLWCYHIFDWSPRLCCKSGNINRPNTLPLNHNDGHIYRLTPSKESIQTK